MNQRTLVGWLLLVCLLFFSFSPALAVTDSQYVVPEAAGGRLGIIVDGRPLPLVVSGNDHAGVMRVAKLLQKDLERVAGTAPDLSTDESVPAREAILIGTLGTSPLIDRLVREKKLDVSDVAGKWETFVLQVVEQPLDGVDRALVIAGSDKRGTIFGMFDLSLQIGVSPWHFWTDVPVRRQKNLYVLPGQHTDGTPAVKYRGIFINDEAPALAGWAHEKFGGFNARFYNHVFELILRLKGNYLWPAMWGRSIYDDDPQSPKLADEYGVVLGTSHHEPLSRAHVEWERYGEGPWNYDKNEKLLREFWAEGIRRMGTNESIVTIGMRGDGDEPMTESANIALLERIVRDQRDIIAKETGRDAAEQPQIWALYKEVQEYYDKGMRVPEDVTLLLCDDNWGNIRKLPHPLPLPAGEGRGEGASDAAQAPSPSPLPKGEGSRSARPGGYGIYYHFDYVGGPRNYKWLNTNPLPRIWEQMHLAYEHGVDRIWIVNVGDIKPMELPTEFFLDYAWNPDRWPADRLAEYTRRWAAEQFGEAHAAEIADILAKYLKYNARRKPELLAPETYSLTNFREADRIVDDYNVLAAAAQRINEQLPAEDRDAFFQLVLYPVEACANLNELYVTVAKNRRAADEGRADTNALAERARQLFAKDAELSRYYNEDLAGGKWSHMADQTHIGYTYWQEPPKNEMPAVVEIDEAASGTGAGSDNAQSANEALVESSLPRAHAEGAFAEADGFICIEAEHFSRAVADEPIRWQVIPDLGRTLSAVTTLPSTQPANESPADDTPHLEYQVRLSAPGSVKVHALLSPTLDFYNNAGLRYAVSFDDQPPQIVNIHAGENLQVWEKWVADNINETTSEHALDRAGEHTLKFWRVDPGIVLQRLIIERGNLPDSYLGPPESNRVP